MLISATATVIKTISSQPLLFNAGGFSEAGGCALVGTTPSSVNDSEIPAALPLGYSTRLLTVNEVILGSA